MTLQTFGQVYALVGGRLFVAIALRLAPLVALDLATLLMIRLFFMELYLQAEGVAAVGVPAAVRGHGAGAIGAALLALLVLRLGAGYLVSRGIHGVVFGAQERLTANLFANYLGQPYRAQRDSSRSEQRQTLFIAATALVTQMLLPIVQLFTDLIVALAVALVLLIREPMATAVVIVWLGLWFAVQAAATLQASRRAGAARWDALNRMRTIADAALGDPRLSKLSANEAQFTRRFREQARRHGRASAEEGALLQIPVFARELVLATSVCLLIAVLTLEHRSAAAQIGAIALFAAAAVRLLPALQRSVTLVQKLNSYAADFHRIDADRQIEIEPLEAEAASDAPLIKDALRLRDVAFRYPLAPGPVLEKVDLTLRRGDRLLITGPSGGGKSTLILVMCGLLRADRGVIELDGSSSDILARIRRGRVALAPQDPFVADLTILENIALPGPPEGIDRERAARLLRELRLDCSLDDRAGENGARLSGGERQRLAILRAIQRRPELLILDEATSQLDAETEGLVYRCIARECPDATILAISHRPPPPGVFDRRVLLENGRLHSADADALAPDG